MSSSASFCVESRQIEEKNMKNIERMEVQNKTVRQLTIMAAILLPMVIFLVVAGSLSAQELEPDAVAAANLVAAKSVSPAQAQPGDTLQYMITVTNTGDSLAGNASITDTLPAELAILPGTLASSNGGNFGVSGQVITWTGGVNNGSQLILSFDAVLTDTAPVGTITNTALVTGTGMLMMPAAAFDVVIDPPVLALTKTVNINDARPGDSLAYGILLQNSGGSSANNMVMTDNLPAELSYISNTLTITGGGSYGISGNVITWTGSLTESESVMLQFSALITDSLVDSGTITNTVYAVGAGESLSSSVQTSYATAFMVYLPVIFKPLPAPTLSPISLPTSPDGLATYSVTADWTTVDEATGYELWESASSNFANPTVYSAGTATSVVVSHPTGFATHYYYCAIALGVVNSGCSNIREQSGMYVDNFGDHSSGWAIRRQDTDDVNNWAYYTTDFDSTEYWAVKIGGRWDYAITAPLQPVPASWATGSGYRIDTRVILGDGIDNLHSYGLVFGGDLNGECPPNSQASNCFNHYYRLNVVWHDSSSFVMQLKRIDYHDASNNSGKGVELIHSKDIYNVDPNGWNDWAVVVKYNGDIEVYANGALVGQAHDTQYNGTSTYFGTFSSADEYLGTLASYDYYRVSPFQ